MSAHKFNDFNDRRTAAADARRAALERFQARPAADSPEVLERQAALKAASDARDRRMAERAAARKVAEEAEAAKQRAEQEALAAAEAAKVAEQAKQKAEAVARAAELAAAQKAARDARYAARTSRRR